MSRKKEIILLLLSDFIAINGGWVALYVLRFHTSFFHSNPQNVPLFGDIITTSLLVYGFWLIAFLFFGLYRQWYVRPMFDEVITVLKTLLTGTIIFLLVVWWDTPDISMGEHSLRNDPRMIGLLYFVLLAIFVVSLRLIVRYSQKRLLTAGYGRRTSLILGEASNAEVLAADIKKYPALGYEVIGYVSTNEHDTTVTSKVKYFGPLSELEIVVAENNIRELLITLNSGEHKKLLDIIGQTATLNVGLKIVPDLYDIVSGQARTREIYGFPLIDINPEIQRPWERATKRGMDIVISALGLVIGLPLWGIVALGVKLTSRGPAIYKQERVGLNSKTFNIFKFRSMTIDAEKGGPQWAQKNDPRVTTFGRFIRKTHLDEFPQLWNVLRGDMSLVGPRPERPHFVKILSEDIPYYSRRLKVRPGITGLYQAMVDKYDETMDDVKERVRYDLMYIESMTFRLDMKIIFRTAYMMIRGKGQA